MKSDTKLTLLIVLFVVGLLAIVCALVKIKYEVNKERFPNAPSWTWWW